MHNRDARGPWRSGRLLLETQGSQTAKRGKICSTLGRVTRLVHITSHLSKLFAPTKHKTIPQPLATSRNPSRPLSQTLRTLSWPLSQPLATSRDLSRRKHRTFGRRTLPKRATILCTSCTSHLITSHTTPPTDEARATSRNPFATSHTTSCNLACPSLPPSQTLL